jgi:hypothetical protein
MSDDIKPVAWSKGFPYMQFARTIEDAEEWGCKVGLYDQATVEALQAKVSALEEEIKVLKESKNG